MPTLCETVDKNPCTSIPCANGATCHRNSPTTFNCQCTADYSGASCQQCKHTCEVLHCWHIYDSSVLGEEHATMSSVSSDYVVSCIDVNPCSSGPCQNSGTCERLSPYNFRCRCATDYEGYYCQQCM